MPGWAKPHDEQSDDSWKLVLYIRSLRNLTNEERTQQTTAMNSTHYTGSVSCQKCHLQIYEHWRKTPMANVVRDPRDSPNVIIPDLSTNKIAKFTKDQVAPVYGSLWKQRYFTKMGDDYYPEPAQWDVTNKVWRPYFVANGTDWWATLYPPDNMPCSGPPAPLATVATPSATTSAPKKSPNGTSAANAATAPAASTSRFPRARIF
jgi:hypothetical protein